MSLSLSFSGSSCWLIFPHSSPVLLTGVFSFFLLISLAKDGQSCWSLQRTIFLFHWFFVLFILHFINFNPDFYYFFLPRAVFSLFLFI
jgi:hypothetical protein